MELGGKGGRRGSVIKILFSMTTPFHASFFWCHAWDECGMGAQASAACSQPAQVEAGLISLATSAWSKESVFF